MSKKKIGLLETPGTTRSGKLLSPEPLSPETFSMLHSSVSSSTPPKFIPIINYLKPTNYSILNKSNKPYTIDEIIKHNDITTATDYKQFLERVIFSCYIDMLLTDIGKVSKELDELGYKIFLMGGLAVRRYTNAQYTTDIDLKIFQKSLLEPDTDPYGIHKYGTPIKSEITFKQVSDLLTPYLENLNSISNFIIHQYIVNILQPIYASTNPKIKGFIDNFITNFRAGVSGAGVSGVASGAGAGAGVSGAGAGVSGVASGAASGAGAQFITLKVSKDDKNPKVLKILAYIRGDKTTTWYPGIGNAIIVKIGDITIYDSKDINFQIMLNEINNGSNLIPSEQIRLGYTTTSDKLNGYLYVPKREYLLAEKNYLINYYTTMTRENMKEDNITEPDRARYIKKFTRSMDILSAFPPLPRVFIGV